MNEELLNSKLSDENIDVVLEYLKENVKDYDMSNIKYKKDENGDFIIMFDGKEIKLPKDYTVGESLSTINSALDIKEPSIPSSLLSEEEKNKKPGNQKPSLPEDFNIAIDLEYYTELIGLLSNYQAASNSFINDNFEFGSLSGELLSFYNANFSDSYSSKYHSIIESTGKLYENTQMALMYYLSIDENLTKNIDTIMDSIFSDDFELTQLMYSMANKEKISYEDYVSLMKDNQDYFNQQRIQFLSEFMLKFETYADQFKSIEMPKMLDSIIEMAFYAKYSKGEEYDWNGSAYDDGKTLSNDLNDELLTFKAELAKAYFKDKGYDINSLDSIDHSLISDNYWILNTDKNNDEWVKKYDPNGNIYGYDDIIAKHDLYNKFLLYSSYYEDSFTSISIIMARDNDYLKEQLKYPNIDDSAFIKINEAFKTIDDVRTDFNSLYKAHLDKVDEFVKHSSEWDSDKINEFCKSYITLLNKGYGDIGPSNSYMTIDGSGNKLKYRYENSFYDFRQNFNFYNDVVINDFKNDIDDDCETESFVRTLCKYRGIEDEKLIEEMLQFKDDYKESMAIPNMLSVIYKESGYDGMCAFLADYYNNIRDYCAKNNDFQPFDHEVTESEVKVLLMQRPETLYFSAIASAGNLYDFSSKIAKELNNNMVYIKNTQETAELYFTKKLDTSSVTDEMRKKAKSMFNSDDLDYLEEWQIDAYALLLSIDSSDSGFAWNLYHDGSPRGAFNNIIIQGRAYDGAKDQVEVMTAAKYIWATISGFSIGTYEGVGNFIAGLSDVIWADGEVSEAEYRQQFVRQLLTTDYSLFQQYRDKDPKILDMLSANYDDSVYLSKLKIKNLTSKEVEEMITYAKNNNIPRYEIEYMLDMISEEEYSRYKSLYQMKDKQRDIEYFASLADKSWLTGYTNTIYSVGQGVGNMLIPLTLNILSGYCPVLSYLSIGLTSLSSLGKQRESLMQQGVTNQGIIWTSSILHGIIEGLGEAVFGKVLETSWGKHIYSNLEKIPGIGKLLTMTDDIIGKIDNLPFGTPALKQFLKNDLKEIFEELGENAWGYLVDGTLGLGWPTTEEFLAESWQTIWQTALTTPILNAFSGEANKTLKKKITLANGMVITLSLSDLYSCRNEKGEIDSNKLFKLLQANNAISGKVTLNTITSRMNEMFGYSIVSECVYEDGKQYIVLYNGRRIEFDVYKDTNLVEKVFKENPSVLYNLVYNSSDGGVNLNLNGVIKDLDSETIKDMFSAINADKVLEIAKRLDNDSFQKVFDNLNNHSLNSELVQLYKSRILQGIDLNQELNKIFDGIPLNSLPYSEQKSLEVFRKLNWNDMYIPIETLNALKENSNDVVNTLFKLIKNNIKFGDSNSQSYSNMVNSFINLLSNNPSYDTTFVLNEVVSLLDLKGTNLKQQEFINELKKFIPRLRFESSNDENEFKNRLLSIILDSYGQIDYLALTKLVCQTSEAGYRLFNKYYATEVLCDYLANNSDLDESVCSSIIKLMRNNGDISFTELRSFFTNGDFDYIGFLEFGLNNFRFTNSTYLIGEIDFIKDLKNSTFFDIMVEFDKLTSEIKNEMQSLSTEEFIAYLKKPGSDYKKLSLIANYLARDVNLRNTLETEFRKVGEFLREQTFKIIKAGPHQEFEFNGIKINLYGSNEYIAAAKINLQNIINDLPDVYLKALRGVKLELYGYQDPDNLLSLFNYYKGDPSHESFMSGGSYNYKSKSLSLFVSINEGHLYHELGHAIDNVVGDYYGYGSDGSISMHIWQTIKENDDKINGGKSISDYANTAIYEDFAEFSKMFGVRLKEYCKNHPERTFNENLLHFKGESSDLSERSLADDYPNRFNAFKEILFLYYVKIQEKTNNQNNGT
jgi:hypothetical protein